MILLDISCRFTDSRKNNCGRADAALLNCRIPQSISRRNTVFSETPAIRAMSFLVIVSISVPGFNLAVFTPPIKKFYFYFLDGTE